MEVEPVFTRLRRFNLAMGFVHLFQGVLILALSSNFSLPVIGSFLHYDAVTQMLKPEISTLFTLPIAPMIAVERNIQMRR